MYIRTPKKYRGTQRRSIFPLRRFLMWLFLVGLIVVGIGIYENATMIRPYVEQVAGTAIAGLEDGAATAMAPTATATRDPVNDLVNANNFWDAGSVSEAMRLYRTIVSATPNDVDVHTRLVLGAIIAGDFDKAVEYGQRAVTADPFSSDAWAVQAWALDWAGDPGEAIVSALHARELDPENARAIAWLAEAYLAAEQVQRALSTANRALEINPDSPEAYRARGYIQWVGLFDIPAALDDMQTALDLALATNPALASLIAVDIAQIEIGNQDFDAAIAVLQRVLEMNPENTSALYWVGSIYFANLGDPAQASGFVTRCVEIDPESINCNYLLGRTQARLEQPEAAAQSFIRAIELGSGVARHWWWAANGQVALGHCDRAIPYLQTGYEMAKTDDIPDLIEAYEYLMGQCQLNTGITPATPTPPPADSAPDETT